MHHPRALAGQILDHRLTVDGVGDGLAHLLLLHRRVGGGAAGGVELQEADAHRFGRQHGDVRHRLQLVRLILRHAPDPVDAAGHQLGHAGFAVGDDAELDLADGGLAERAVFEIVLVLLHQHALAVLHRGDAVGAGADGRLGEAVQPDLLEIGGGIDRRRAGQIFQRRRERALQTDAHRVVVDLVGPGHPFDVLLGHHLRFRRQHVIESEDHVVGGEGRAVLKGHALAQGKFQRDRIDPFPRGRQLRLILAGLGIPVDQRVPHEMGDDDAFAQIVVIGADVLRLAVGSVDQRVVRLVGKGHRRQGQGRDRRSCEHHRLTVRKGRHVRTPSKRVHLHES